MNEVTPIRTARCKPSTESASVTRVLIETPEGNDLVRDTEYSLLCVRHSGLTGKEAPVSLAMLNERTASELRLKHSVEKKIFYVDRGFSEAMQKSYIRALAQQKETEFRTLSLDANATLLVRRLNEQTHSARNVQIITRTLKALEKLNFSPMAETGDASFFRETCQAELLFIEALNGPREKTPVKDAHSLDGLFSMCFSEEDNFKVLESVVTWVNASSSGNEASSRQAV